MAVGLLGWLIMCSVFWHHPSTDRKLFASPGGISAAAFLQPLQPLYAAAMHRPPARHRLLLGFSIVLSAAATLIVGAAAAATPALYEQAVAASVEVLTDDQLDGSGFVIDSAGLVVTAAHAVPDSGRRIEVRSPIWGRRPVKIVARDVGHDIALLELPRRPEPYPALKLADRSAPVGSDVYLLGAPLFRHQVLLRAMVARGQPTYEYLPDQQYYLRIVHLSGPSPVGTSGGPWMNGAGQVVGLQSGLMHDGGVAVGIAYMAPAAAIARLLETRRDAVTPTLRIGFEELWEQSEGFRRRFPPQLEALVAGRVTPGGPAARAGLRPRDVITHIGEKRVRLRDEIIAAIREMRPGEPVDLKVLRPGEAPRTVRIATARLETEVARP